MRNHHIKSNARQSGSALLIAVVLLLLAGVMTLVAMNVGIFEQRSTANDVRAKAVHEVAEAGLAQGAEYLLRQHPELLVFDETRWKDCTTEVTFPCGSISTANVDADGDPATNVQVTRKSTMYRLQSGGISSGATFDALGSSLASRMLPMSQTITTVGSGFPVAYGVAPVMCFVANRHPDEPANSPIRCATTAEEASDRRIVTLVSVATIVGENARTTLTQTVGRYPLLGDPSGSPPLVASGSIDVAGNLSVVTNPNSGGTGVAVSVWSRRNLEKTGSPTTCYNDEFLRYGAASGRDVGNASVYTANNGEFRTILCDTCQCHRDRSLSYPKSGPDEGQEGMDILDVEGTSADRGDGTNYNVRSDANSLATWGRCEFPRDLFKHVFGESAWEDLDPVDCFAETKRMVDFIDPNTGAVHRMGADEAFLYTNAKKIKGDATSAAYALATAAQKGGTLDANASGLIWCQDECNIGSGQQVGRPESPVVLVVDGPVDVKGIVYGLIFVRTLAGGTLTPADGYVMDEDEVEAGGNGDFDIGGNAAIYGAVVIQGRATNKGTGTGAIIHNGEVLAAIARDPNNSRFATLPGAWNDRSTY
jgi:Tfp pilus assembly protein PilX